MVNPEMREQVLRMLLAGDDGSAAAGANAQATAVPDSESETTFEVAFDALVGIVFLITAILASRRMSSTRQQGGPETTVVTAFYSLILVTSGLRAIYFLIPSFVWVPSYVPVAVSAWDKEYPSWIGASLSEVVLMAGSLALFSIFILILVYWADILKKYFHPASRRSIPMVTFLKLVGILVGLELINMICFLCGFYSTEGMILFNSILLALVSMVCVVEISIFSHRFRTVLKTLGAINQVSTDSQVKRIRYITVTGNVFFFTRAFLEIVLCVFLILWWEDEHTVARTFSHFWWDSYVMAKTISEILILSLMLYILQSRFATTSQAPATTGPGGRPGGYVEVPNAEEATKEKSSLVV